MCAISEVLLCRENVYISFLPEIFMLFDRKSSLSTCSRYNSYAPTHILGSVMKVKLPI